MSFLILRASLDTALVFKMVLAADHVTPATGLSPTVTISKAGGAFASPAGAVTEIGSGWYKVAPNSVDNNTIGPLLLHATVGTADPANAEFQVAAFLSQFAAQSVLISPSAVVNGMITARAGDTWTLPITGLGNISDAAKIWFVIKRPGEDDSAAVLFASSTDGLMRVIGMPPASSALASITIDNAITGDITVHVSPVATGLFHGISQRHFTVKKKTHYESVTLAEGKFRIIDAGVTHYS